MKRVIWSAQAQRDIAGILRYYGSEDPGLAERVERAIVASPDFLLGYPHAGPAIGKRGLRKWRVGQLPLVLLYRLESDSIAVARVRHMSENWRRSS